MPKHICESIGKFLRKKIRQGQSSKRLLSMSQLSNTHGDFEDVKNGGSQGWWKETAGRSTPARPVLKLRKTRISRTKQLRRAIRLWFVCVF